MCCEEIFLKRLQDRGFRLTPQRDVILQAMHHVDGHATAEEIHGKVHSISSAIDISTVYRTLELLQELHLVAAVDLGDGQRRYELLGDRPPHPHLHCRLCGKLVRIDESKIRPLIDCVGEMYGFRAEPSHLIMPGVCQECRVARATAPAAESASASSVISTSGI